MHWVITIFAQILCREHNALSTAPFYGFTTYSVLMLACLANSGVQPWLTSFQIFCPDSVMLPFGVHHVSFQWVCRGPGWYQDADGTYQEEYWMVDDSVQVEPSSRMPYRIELVGVTCDPGEIMPFLFIYFWIIFVLIVVVLFGNKPADNRYTCLVLKL